MNTKKTASTAASKQSGTDKIKTASNTDQKSDNESKNRAIKKSPAKK
jgi:hypothetical protein